MGKPNLFGMSKRGLAGLVAERGEPAFRGRQLYGWLYERRARDLAAMSDLPQSLRASLAADFELRWPEVQERTLSFDGTRKYLFRLDDGATIEAVYIPEDARRTICISTQAGCPLKCVFCLTGIAGYKRNLKPWEILGQVATVMDEHPVAATHPDRRSDDPFPWNVVMMGMGEPLTNFDNVVAALYVMLDDNAYGLSRRRVTVSTSGIVPNIDRLRAQCPVALAVSLHAPDDALRDVLVPINRKYPLAQLMSACRRYVDSAPSDAAPEHMLPEALQGKWQREGSPRDFITFEYVMLEGVNDQLQQARKLIELTREVPCKFNLIPFNSFPDSGYRRSRPEQVRAFQEVLQQAGLIATVRRTRGDDIDGACGQLAGEVQDRTRRTLKRSTEASL